MCQWSGRWAPSSSLSRKTSWYSAIILYSSSRSPSAVFFITSFSRSSMVRDVFFGPTILLISHFTFSVIPGDTWAFAAQNAIEFFFPPLQCLLLGASSSSSFLFIIQRNTCSFFFINFCICFTEMSWCLFCLFLVVFIRGFLCTHYKTEALEGSLLWVYTESFILVLPNPCSPLTVSSSFSTSCTSGVLICSGISWAILSPIFMSSSSSEWLNITTPTSPW